MSNKLGGWSDPKDDTPDVQGISDEVRSKVECFTGKCYVEYRAVQYRSQIVKGENFLIKVFVGVEDYIHLSVFRPLPCQGKDVVLYGVEQQRTKEDPLRPFTI